MKFLIIATCIVAYQVAVLYVESATPHQDNVDVDVGRLLNVSVSPNQSTRHATDHQDTINVDIGGLLEISVSPNGRTVKVHLYPRYVPEEGNDYERRFLNQTTGPVEIPKNRTVSDADGVADSPVDQCSKTTGANVYLLPHPTEIEMFLLCDHGVAFKFVCPDILYFRVDFKVCGWNSSLIQ